MSRGFSQAEKNKMDFARTLLTGVNAHRTVGDVFLSRLPDDNPGGCWVWSGKLFNNGYGSFRVCNRDYLAHRVSYEYFSGGAVPQGMVVMHTCDNPGCVNPKHLRAGTHADNMRDMLTKRRGNPRRGEKSPNSKLTESDVSRIRESRLSQKELALSLGISPKQVSVVKRGLQWAHVPSAATGVANGQV